MGITKLSPKTPKIKSRVLFPSYLLELLYPPLRCYHPTSQLVSCLCIFSLVTLRRQMMFSVSQYCILFSQIIFLSQVFLIMLSWERLLSFFCVGGGIIFLKISESLITKCDPSPGFKPYLGHEAFGQLGFVLNILSFLMILKICSKKKLWNTWS